MRFPCLRPVAACVVALSVAASSSSQELAPASESGAPEDEAAPEAEEISWLEGPGLSGTWGGRRASWEEQGILVSGSYLLDVSRPVSGGLRERTTGQGLLDVNVALDLATLAGWEGASVYADFYVKHGRLANDDVGDWQGTSNIDRSSGEQLAELWFEQWFADERWRLKLGKLDAWNEFAYVENSADFLNNSLGYVPTLFVMTGYPDPASGLSVFAHPCESSWLGVGVFDGATQAGIATGSHGPDTFFGSPSDLFLIAEADHTWSCGEGELAGRIAVGGWRHTGTFSRFAGGDEDGTNGLYVILDQVLSRENPEAEDDAQGLGASLLLGSADEELTEIQRSIGCGLAWTGAIDGRDEDVLGLGASWALFSDETAAGFTADAEQVLEAFYKFRATPWASVQPDLQLVRDPAGDASADDVLVASVRIEITL